MTSPHESACSVKSYTSNIAIGATVGAFQSAVECTMELLDKK